MSALAFINSFIRWGVTAVIMAAILLIILRSIFNYVDVNPFTWHARNVRRVTDPVIAPVRRALIAFRLDPQVAPFIVVLLIIVTGYLAVQIAGTVLNTVAGILYAVTFRRLQAPVGITGSRLVPLRRTVSSGGRFITCDGRSWVPLSRLSEGVSLGEAG